MSNRRRWTLIKKGDGVSESVWSSCIIHVVITSAAVQVGSPTPSSGVPNLHSATCPTQQSPGCGNRSSSKRQGDFICDSGYKVCTFHLEVFKSVLCGPFQSCWMFVLDWWVWADTFPFGIVIVPSVLSATDNPGLHLATGRNRKYTF